HSIAARSRYSYLLPTATLFRSTRAEAFVGIDRGRQEDHQLRDMRDPAGEEPAKDVGAVYRAEVLLTGKGVEKDFGPVHGSDVFGDRKSTRLNSSHSQISYAVFC